MADFEKLFLAGSDKEALLTYAMAAHRIVARRVFWTQTQQEKSQCSGSNVTSFHLQLQA